MRLTILSKKIDRIIDRLFACQDDLAVASDKEAEDKAAEIEVWKREFDSVTKRLDDEIYSLFFQYSLYSQKGGFTSETHCISHKLTTDTQPLTSEEAL